MRLTEWMRRYLRLLDTPLPVRPVRDTLPHERTTTLDWPADYRRRVVRRLSRRKVRPGNPYRR